MIKKILKFETKKVGKVNMLTRAIPIKVDLTSPTLVKSSKTASPYSELHLSADVIFSLKVSRL